MLFFQSSFPPLRDILKLLRPKTASLKFSDFYGLLMGFPGGARGKVPASNAGDIWDTGSIPAFGRSPGEGNGNPLQYSCLENLSPTDRRACWATVHRFAELDMTEET